MEKRYFGPGDLCKHFKGKSLLEKNIYEILVMGATYTGTNSDGKIEDLVVYKNIFDGKERNRARETLLLEICHMMQQDAFFSECGSGTDHFFQVCHVVAEREFRQCVACV